MKIFFYAAINSQGNRTTLVRRADTAFESLPNPLKEAYKSIEAQEDDVDVSDMESRWWLCNEAAENLRTKGWDASSWPKVKAA